VAHAYPIVTRMAESRPKEAVVASRYNFRVVTTGQGFVSVSEHPTCMVRGPAIALAATHTQFLGTGPSLVELGNMERLCGSAVYI